jgi:hypothetical protein
MAKTLFLFEDEAGAHLFEIDGDHSRFHDVYINAEVPEGDARDEETYEALQQELCDLIYYDEDSEGGEAGELKPDEIEAPTKDWDFFVRCGFIG